jgi:lysophospholipase L1-like esterase
VNSSTSAPPSSRPSQKLFAFIGYVVFSIILAAAVLELGAFAIWTMSHGTRPDGQVRLGSASPATSEYPWAAEFWKEEAQRRKSHNGGYIPFRIWGTPEWHGKYVNNDRYQFGVVRRTIDSMGPDCKNQPVMDIWMFGGSTLYGSGVPDWATIPSLLAKDLNGDPNRCVVITNFGTEAYNTNQELLLLIEQLKVGRRPDAVIFYDGVNDSYSGVFAPGIATAHMHYAAISSRVEGDLAGKVDFLRHSYALLLVRRMLLSRQKQDPAASETETKSKAVQTLDNYEANLRMVQALAGIYHFSVYSFWQPSLAYGSKPAVPYEKELIRADANSFEGSALKPMHAAYEEAELRAAKKGNFVFLGNVLDSEVEPLYLDEWHLGPKGNELIAQAIARKLSASLTSPQLAHRR